MPDDYPDRYKNGSIQTECRVTEQWHFLKIDRTTCTFATYSDVVKKNKKTFLKFINWPRVTEEKSINKADISLNRCYFLIKKCKNITLATFIATKIITNSHMQAYYKYILLEEIKLYLINKLKKTRNKLTMKNIEISSVILYSQLLDLFKIEIYDAVCSQIEYFDILKNNISTEKAT
jgi:hypothetical protein